CQCPRGPVPHGERIGTVQAIEDATAPSPVARGGNLRKRRLGMAVELADQVAAVEKVTVEYDRCCLHPRPEGRDFAAGGRLHDRQRTDPQGIPRRMDRPAATTVSARGCELEAAQPLRERD